MFLNIPNPGWTASNQRYNLNPAFKAQRVYVHSMEGSEEPRKEGRNAELYNL